MGWTRFGELSAETQSLADVAGLGGAGYAVSSTVAFTGAWSYRTSGSNAPLGFAGAFGAAARAGMQFRHNGQTSVRAAVIGMLVDGAPLTFRFDKDNNDVTLLAGYTYDTTNVRTALTVNVPALADINTWRHIGMTASMLSSGGFVSLYVDGVQVAEWVGDTQLYRSKETTPRTSITGIYAAGSHANWVGTQQGTWSNYAYIDDFYADWWSGESAPSDAPVPTRRFGIATLTADVAANWTPTTGSDNYAMLDDIPPDDDTTTVTATAADVADQYEIGGFNLPVDHAVRAVIPLALARKTDAGVDSRIELTLARGANSVESDAKVLAITYGYIWERWTEQPDGTTPWDETAVNASKVGLVSAGDF